MIKKISVLLAALLLSVSLLAQLDKAIPPAPNPPRLVNDYANLLTEEQRQYLERKLVAYNDSTSTQIAIVTVTSLQGYAAVDFATELGRKWGVGGRENNNGIVILVSTGQGENDDGRDAFIAPGYGLEGAIPDITANTILTNELIPDLSAGNYFQAFNKATDALMQAAAGEYKASPRDRSGRKGGISIGQILLILLLLFFLFSRGGRNNRGGGFASRRGYRGLWGPPIIGGGLGGLGGGRGGFGGGGFGGGGFGGFGGGGFGGGGAGGRW